MKIRYMRKIQKALNWHKSFRDPNPPLNMYETLAASGKHIRGKVWHDIAHQFQEKLHLGQCKTKLDPCSLGTPLWNTSYPANA